MFLLRCDSRNLSEHLSSVQSKLRMMRMQCVACECPHLAKREMLGGLAVLVQVHMFVAMSDAHKDIIGLYHRHANAWIQRRSTQLFEQSWLDRFLSVAVKDATLLDVGCGAGAPFAQYLS